MLVGAAAPSPLAADKSAAMLCDNDEDALTSNERHRYVWEHYVTSYMIDAVTGEQVR